MDESFIRQRRNLLITSIIVFLISFAGIEIDNNLVLFGTKFKINDPLIIYISIWIMLFYFLLRYFQYYIELDEEYREYNFPSYPWKGFRDEHQYNILNIIWLTIVFVFMNIVGTFVFIMNSIIHKNFTETLLPLLFAIFVILISFQTPLVQKKYDEATAKIHVFKEKIYNKTIDKLIFQYNNIIKSLNF